MCDKQYPVGTKQKGASPNIYLSVTTCANEFVAILAETQVKKNPISCPNEREPWG